MTQNSDTALGQRFDFVLATHTALQLDSIHATLLDNACAVVNALLNRLFLRVRKEVEGNVGAERHITDNHREFSSSR